MNQIRSKKEETCQTCKYSHQGAVVICRRYPTQIEKDAKDWCGEWGKKKN